MDYKEFRVRLEELVNAYRLKTENVKFTLKEPATEKDVKALEEKINYKLPKSIRDFFINFSKDVELYVHLEEDLVFEGELSQIFSASFRFSLEEILESEESRISWQEECFYNIEDEYDRVWHNKIGIMSVGNGDIIALEKNEKLEETRVVYLSHDGCNSNGLVLGKTFEEYVENLIFIGAPGREDWQLEPFCKDKESGINSNLENSRKYRAIIGLK